MRLPARLERRMLGTGCCQRCQRPWKTRAKKYLGYRDGSHHWQQLDRQAWWGLDGLPDVTLSQIEHAPQQEQKGEPL